MKLLVGILCSLIDWNENKEWMCCVLRNFLYFCDCLESICSATGCNQLWMVIGWNLIVTSVLKILYGSKIWASARENLSKKGADQHAGSLISTFVIRFLESIISKLVASETSIF